MSNNNNNSTNNSISSIISYNDISSLSISYIPSEILMDSFEYLTYNQLVTCINCINKYWKIIVIEIIDNSECDYFININLELFIEVINSLTIKPCVKRAKIYNTKKKPRQKEKHPPRSWFSLNTTTPCISLVFPKIGSVIWSMGASERIEYFKLLPDHRLIDLTIEVGRDRGHFQYENSFEVWPMPLFGYLSSITKSVQYIMFDGEGNPFNQIISEANFTNIIIEICPNLISLIIVDMDFKWTNFSKLSELKQLETLGMYYNDDDWLDNYRDSETILPEELYTQIQQYNAFPQLSNFIIYMAYIPGEFIINPPTTIAVNKQNNNTNNTDRAGGEQTIKIVFKVKPMGRNRIYTVLNVITSTGRNLLCLE